ncbi:MAG: Tm-1-like ATP-binding domain-containing protein [Syntrophorhabdales bacterium]|jgi:uncharacterized protein (UPF0261 family)
MGRVLLLSSLDTRGKETFFLKEQIQDQGAEVSVMDISMRSSAQGRADYDARSVAAAGGVDFDEISNSSDTNRAMDCMVRGAASIAHALYDAGQIDGLAGLGGTSTVTVISLVMKTFPFGVPKLILTSSAAMPSLAHRFFVDSDVAIFHSCVELSGLNSFVGDVIVRFAGMAAGAVRAARAAGRAPGRSAGSSDHRPVALSGFKFSAGCAHAVRTAVEAEGFEVVSFSSTGTSDRIMEAMVAQGLFCGVIDLVPAGLSESILGGNRAAGMDRLDRELRAGIPVVLTPCGFDMISCGPYERRAADPFWRRRQIEKRRLFIPDAFRVQARSTGREMGRVAKVLAGKCNGARGRVIFFVPKKGFSALSVEGGPLFDPAADRAFLRTFKRYLQPGRVEIVEMDTSMDDPAFARALAERFLAEVRRAG